MSERFNNRFGFGSTAAAESRFACSSSDNNGLMLTMDTVSAVSVFVVIESIIIRIISVIVRIFNHNRPFPVSEA